MIIWFLTCDTTYALVKNILSLCMIMAVIALLVGRSQSFASLHLYWERILLVHPTPKNQSFSKDSTTNSYAWYFKPFQVNFHVLPFKTFKYLSFCDTVLAHEDVVVGFAIFHIELSTPQLACFIYLSLILQESWSDHCNL
jgi:hypothetical protein